MDVHGFHACVEISLHGGKLCLVFIGLSLVTTVSYSGYIIWKSIKNVEIVLQVFSLYFPLTYTYMA